MHLLSSFRYVLGRCVLGKVAAVLADPVAVLRIPAPPSAVFAAGALSLDRPVTGDAPPDTGMGTLFRCALRSGTGMSRDEGGRLTTDHYPLTTGTERAGPRFRVLTLVTVLSIFALITLGGVVRLTESGLGCPDWPLCHGKIIPPLDTATLIEYSHRLMASVVGVLVLATTLIVWRSHRRQPWLLVPATLGLALLVGQVLLGGVTVLKELPGSIVMAHLATAEALLACMAVVSMVALLGRPASLSRLGGVGRPGGVQGDAGERPDRAPLMVLGVMLATYGLLLTGSYVTISGSTVACGEGWPLCQGQFLPEGHHALINMAHRWVSLLVGLLIAAALVMAWRRRHVHRAMGWAAATVGGLFLMQVSLGAAIVWAGFAIEARILHLSMSTLVWLGLVALSFLAYTIPNSGPGSGNKSGLKGVSHA